MYLDFLKRRAAVAFKRISQRVTEQRRIPSAVSVLLVTIEHELASTQIYPFYFYQDILKQQHGIDFVEMPLHLVQAERASEKAVGKPCLQIRRIFFQPELHMDGAAQAGVLAYLRTQYPNASIALMDWFAPLHVRYAASANPYIDKYIKKQTYRHFADYAKPTIGDTNLNDYYARRHQIADEPMQFVPPAGLEGKMVLWSNFGLSPQMVDLFLGEAPAVEGRDIDLHARIATNGVAWYKAMRVEAKEAVKSLQNITIASQGRVRRVKFFQEMKRSKLCFSPFGYGEICWRDYEAFATGALLIKPDVGHLQVLPDIFESGVTYVKLDWDLHDLADVVAEYLARPKERHAMALNAFHAMQKHITSARDANLIAELC